MVELAAIAAQAHSDMLASQRAAGEAMRRRDDAFRELYVEHQVPATEILQMVPAGPRYDRLRQIVGTRR